MASQNDNPSSPTYVDFVLRKAAERTKALDMGRGVAIVANFVLLALLVLVLCDHTLAQGMPLWLRIAGNIAVCYVSVVLVVILVALPAFRRLSTRYIASRIEHTQEGFHHTLTSYLDAREDPSVPHEVREAVAQRADEDIQSVALDKTVDERPFLRANIVLIGVLMAFFLFWAASTKDIHASVQRIIHPLSDIPAPSEVRIREVLPGAAEVPRGGTVSVIMRTGRIVPESAYVEVFFPGEEPTGIPMERDAEEDDYWRGEVPAIERSFLYRVAAGDAHSQKYSVLCFAPPIMAKLKLVYHYPEYTHLPERESAEGDIVAPIGTRVDIEAFCSNPLKRAWIAVDDVERPLALTTRDDMLALGSIDVIADGTYAIRFLDVRGASNHPASYQIVAKEDKGPRIAIEDRPREIRVVSQLGIEEIPIEATDDYGVAEVALYWRVNNGATSVRRRTMTPPEREARLVERFDLTEVFSRYGDTLSFFAEAADAYTPRPHRARTLVYVIAYAPSDVEGRLAARDTQAPRADEAAEEAPEEAEVAEAERDAVDQDVAAPETAEQGEPGEADDVDEAEAAETVTAEEELDKAKQLAEAVERLIARRQEESSSGENVAGDEGDAAASDVAEEETLVASADAPPQGADGASQEASPAEGGRDGQDGATDAGAGAVSTEEQPSDAGETGEAAGASGEEDAHEQGAHQEGANQGDGNEATAADSGTQDEGAASGEAGESGESDGAQEGDSDDAAGSEDAASSGGSEGQEASASADSEGQDASGGGSSADDEAPQEGGTNEGGASDASSEGDQGEAGQSASENGEASGESAEAGASDQDGGSGSDASEGAQEGGQDTSSDGEGGQGEAGEGDASSGSGGGEAGGETSEGSDAAGEASDPSGSGPQGGEGSAEGDATADASQGGESGQGAEGGDRESESGGASASSDSSEGGETSGQSGEAGSSDQGGGSEGDASEGDASGSAQQGGQAASAGDETGQGETSSESASSEGGGESSGDSNADGSESQGAEASSTAAEQASAASSSTSSDASEGSAASSSSGASTSEASSSGGSADAAQSSASSGQAGVNPGGTGQGSTAGAGSGERTGADDEFLEALASEIARLIASGDLDEEFFEDANMTEEELVAFTKKYEGITRPKRDQEQNGDDPEDSPETAPGPDAERGLVLGRGFDQDATDLEIAPSDRAEDERFEDLFDEFAGHVSPEYRDLIEAYYKRLARERE